MAADDRFTEDYRGRREDGPVGTRNEIITGPVSDWAADFSHLEPAWAADPYPIQDDLRQRCPIAHTERFRTPVIQARTVSRRPPSAWPGASLGSLCPSRRSVTPRAVTTTHSRDSSSTGSASSTRTRPG